MTSGSILIIGTDNKKIKQYIDKLKKEFAISKDQADLYEIKGEDKSIGISEAKEGAKFLNTKPVIAKKRLLIINNAQKLTIDAQNSLLKTLEEPHDSSQLVLITDKEQSLLPTILSRCKKIKFEEPLEEDKKLYPLAKQFIESRVGERFDLIEDNKSIFADREKSVEFLNNLLLVLKTHYIETKPKEIRKSLEVLNNIKTTNLNTRLALEYLATALS